MNTHIENALGGFVFVLAEDGQVLFMSPNVSENLGLQQVPSFLRLYGKSLFVTLCTYFFESNQFIANLVTISK